MDLEQFHDLLSPRQTPRKKDRRLLGLRLARSLRIPPKDGGGEEKRQSSRCMATPASSFLMAASSLSCPSRASPYRTPAGGPAHPPSPHKLCPFWVISFRVNSSGGLVDQRAVAGGCSGSTGTVRFGVVDSCEPYDRRAVLFWVAKKWVDRGGDRGGPESG